MAEFGDFSFSPEDFSGKARLFPLPNLVLFPQVMQPLHVFESRYRELLEDALAGDRMIAVATLAPGWEADYDGRPPLYPVACLGRIVVHNRLKGGAYNVLLVGLRRVRVVRELPPKKSFREAEVELVEDRYPVEAAVSGAVLQRKLHSAFLRILPVLSQAQDQLDQLLGSDISLGTLTDIISYMLEIDLEQKEVLLAEANVHRRAELLLGHLFAMTNAVELGDAGILVFPPEFSPN